MKKGMWTAKWGIFPFLCAVDDCKLSSAVINELLYFDWLSPSLTAFLGMARDMLKPLPLRVEKFGRQRA